MIITQQKNFEVQEILKSFNKIFIIGCGTCSTICLTGGEDQVEEMARDYAGKILFGKLNIDVNQRVAIQYQIMSNPTFLVFKRGLLMDRIVGVMPRQMLEQRITHYL